VAARFLKLVCKPSREETDVVGAGQRACEMSKQALKIVQQIVNNGSSQYFYLFVASSAGRFGVAARFLKLVCKPSREETEVVDAGQRACEMSKQALKIVQHIANDGSSQYFVSPPEGGA
jgi:preprotein translocase subunit Sss1